TIRSGQAAAGADRCDAATDAQHRFFHRAAHLSQMLEIRAAADVHVNAGHGKAVMIGPAKAVVELLMPNAVLRLFAASIRLLAMAVAEAGIDAEHNRAARRTLP